jgi:hypothetical protein
VTQDSFRAVFEVGDFHRAYQGGGVVLSPALERVDVSRIRVGTPSSTDLTDIPSGRG